MALGSGKYTYDVVDNWANLPEGYSLREVSNIAIDAQDKVYVTDRGDHPVMVFDSKGTLLGQWGKDSLSGPHGCYVGPDGSVYCTDVRSHTVSKFNSKGGLLRVLGNKNQPSETGHDPDLDPIIRVSSIKRSGPPFNAPSDIAVSASGQMYISDGEGNASVHKFDTNGILLLSWGEPGFAPGQFRIPHAVCLDKWERVWIVDRKNNRIQIFSAFGELLDMWLDLHDPSDVCIDKDDIVYVSEEGRQQVSIFNMRGTILAHMGNEGQNSSTALFEQPHSIAVDSQGSIYVADRAMARDANRTGRAIQKFVRKTRK